MAQEVERILGKDEVTSSTLVSSSKNPVHIKWAGFLLFLFLSIALIFRYVDAKILKEAMIK